MPRGLQITDSGLQIGDITAITRKILEMKHPDLNPANELTSGRLAFSPARRYRCTAPPDRLSLHMDHTLKRINGTYSDGIKYN